MEVLLGMWLIPLSYKENFGSGVPMLDSAAVIDIQNKHTPPFRW